MLADHGAARRCLERLVRRHRQLAGRRRAAPGRGRRGVPPGRPRSVRTIERTVAVHVRLPRRPGPVRGAADSADGPTARGSPGAHGRELRAYAGAGIGHVQLVLDPITGRLDRGIRTGPGDPRRGTRAGTAGCIGPGPDSPPYRSELARRCVLASPGHARFDRDRGLAASLSAALLICRDAPRRLRHGSGHAVADADAHADADHARSAPRRPGHGR